MSVHDKKIYVEQQDYYCFAYPLLFFYHFFFSFYFQIDGNTDQQITAADLLWESIQLSISLKRIGITVGETVGLFSENRYEFVTVLLATLYLGARITTFSSAYKESNCLIIYCKKKVALHQLIDNKFSHTPKHR